MEWALLTHDYSLRYVAENNARGTPLLYTITGVWAALEGSILLWGLILAGYLVFAILRFQDRADDPVVVVATVTGLVVALFFFLLMLGPANPFRTLANWETVETNGWLWVPALLGLNGLASYGLLIQLGRRMAAQPVTAAQAVAAAGEPGSAPAVH